MSGDGGHIHNSCLAGTLDEIPEPDWGPSISCGLAALLTSFLFSSADGGLPLVHLNVLLISLSIIYGKGVCAVNFRVISQMQNEMWVKILC